MRTVVAPNLLERNFTADAPNKALVGDLPCLPTHAGWVYLAVPIDLFSPKVVGCAMSYRMDASLCLTAMDRVLATRGDFRGRSTILTESANTRAARTAPL